MTLFTHLTENMIDVSTDAEQRCDRLEAAFKRYMHNPKVDENDLVAALEPFLKDENWTLKQGIDTDILSKSPKNNIVVTQALLYCLEQHGLQASQQTRRYDLFNIPVIHYLAQQNDNHLIVEMNALRAGKQAEEERKQIKFTCSLYAENERLGEALTTFYDHLAHPVEDEAFMQGALHRLLQEIMTVKQLRESEALAWLRTLMLEKLQADKWTFMSLAYERYSRDQEIKYTTLTKRSLSDVDQTELKKVEDTHAKMNTLTKLQAAGMLMGGFTFGIEVGMLILEEAAEEDFLKAWHVLLISAALCWTLGRRLGMFFFRSHIYELTKQNKENYYNTHYLPENTHEKQPISMTAVVGTGAEGLLVLFGLVTSGLFTCDMTTLAIRNAMGSSDRYTTEVFGTYFWGQMMHEGPAGYMVASAVSLLLGIVAVGSAISLTCGHYALDGQETKAYEEKQRKSVLMRQVA